MAVAAAVVVAVEGVSMTLTDGEAEALVSFFIVFMIGKTFWCLKVALWGVVRGFAPMWEDMKEENDAEGAIARVVDVVVVGVAVGAVVVVVVVDKGKEGARGSDTERDRVCTGTWRDEEEGEGIDTEGVGVPVVATCLACAAF